MATDYPLIMREFKSSQQPRWTVFGIPKPFEGESLTIQTAALRSWVHLPDTEIILMGDDRGVADTSATFGVRHHVHLSRSELGTPLLDSAFREIRKIARGRVLIYVNSDILLFEDVLQALSVINFPRFLASTRRMNVDLGTEAKFEETTTHRFLDANGLAGDLDSQWAMDLFAFPRDFTFHLPPFAVGRPGWDNWLVSSMLDAAVPVVDLTPSALILHQRHGYRHVPGGSGNTFEGPEATRNRALAGGEQWLCSLDCATHVVKGGRVRRATGYVYLRASILRLPRKFPMLAPVISMARSALKRLKR